ncbi:MAG: formylmethanofuran dehydrogenase subunit C [Gemmatimonadales bacterium]
MSSGLLAKLKVPLLQRADFSQVAAGSWGSLPATEIARRTLYLDGNGAVALGELFDLRGDPGGRIRLVGDLEHADRIAAGLGEGQVVVEGSVGQEAGMAMAGGTLEITGDAGPRAGAASLGFKRGMTGGELIVHGSAGPEAGASMRRGLIVIGGRAGNRTGLGMIAGTVVVFGPAGAETGLWSKRGSIVALGRITPPETYVHACTFQPAFLRLLLTRLGQGYGLPVRRRHLNGLYRRYSGDMAELGKGEILAWTAE